MAEEGEAAAALLAVTVGGDSGESAAAREDFGLPPELMAVLPEDPFAQLDVARKVTSMALSFRLGRVEAEAARLRAQLAERDTEVEDLRERVEQLDTALGVASSRVRRAEEEKVPALLLLKQHRCFEPSDDCALSRFVLALRPVQISDASSRFGLWTLDIQETLLTEKASLVNTVQKLNRDVAKVPGRRTALWNPVAKDSRVL